MFTELYSDEICDLCGWHDDLPPSASPEDLSGANHCTLGEARKKMAGNQSKNSIGF